MSSAHSYLLLFKWCCIGHQLDETLRTAGKSHLFTRLSYPGAGHLIEPPYAPNARASLWRTKPKKREPQTCSAESYAILVVIPRNVMFIPLTCVISRAVITMWGGHPAAHAAAQEDSWKKILEFMEFNLRQWLKVSRLIGTGRNQHAERRNKKSVVCKWPW